MFKTAATKIAHNSTLPALAGNKDLRPLQDLITAEKAVIVSLQRLSTDYAKASEALRIWGSGEGDDLGDTLSASTTLLTHFATALSQHAAHGHPMREYLKSIRTREENLDELKRRRKAVSSKADTAEKKLSKMSPEHKNLHMQTDSLNVLRAEIRSLDSDIMSEEAALGDFKRTTTRLWVGLKFGALLECSEKGTIVGEYGKQVIAEIPEEMTQPGMARSLYYGHAQTQALVSEAYRCINEVQLSTSLAPGPSVPHLPSYPPNSSTAQSSYQGEGDPSTPATVGFQPHDVSPPGGAPPNYLPPQQGLGTGQFFDQARSSMPASPIQPNQTPPYPQIEPHEPRPQLSVDDFGVNTSTSSMPPNSANGRFATYPEKTRPGGIHAGYALRDDPPSSSGPRESNGSQHPSGSTSGQFDTIHEPAPNYDAPYTPTQGPSSWSATHNRGNPSNASQDEVILAYTAMDGHHHGDQSQAHEDDRHVRFGDVSDVNEEIERRGGPHQPSSSPQQQHAQPSAMRSSLDSAREHPPQGQVGIGNISPIRDQQFSNQQYIPHPAMNPEDEERELNAAAAREVSREMDALTFNPPVPPHIPGSFRDASPDPSAIQHSRGPGFGGAPIPADFAPLAPPSAPFTRRTPSPRPSMDAVMPPYPGASPSITPAQAYAQAHTSSPSLERVSLEHGSSMGPRVNTTVTPATHLHDEAPARSSPLSTTHSPYQTPPEHQRALGSNVSLGGSPTPNFKSTSSSNLPPGPRTISAAAFRRPPGRVGAGDAPPADTSPLMLKKRLPSSPHPQQHRDPSPMSRSSSLPPLPGNPSPGQIQNHQRQGGGGDLDEDYDYLSAYVNAGPVEDAGSLGPLRIANESSEGGAQHVQGGYSHGRGGGGYGDGRFATDLEGFR